MKAAMRLIVVTMMWVWFYSAAPAQTAEEPVILIRMPDEAALANEPTDVDVARFVASKGTYLHMTEQDLLRDHDLARQVLGQNQIFDELAHFQAQHRIAVKVKFIKWGDAFRYFSDYVSDPTNPPIVAQLGDTWAAYFRSLGVMPYEQRHTWDVRLLWYWKDTVNVEEIADGDGFVAACQRLHEAPPPELVAPFIISTSPDWNFLHDFSIWLYNAGLPSLISTDKKLGMLPWKEARFAGPEGERATQFLIDLTKRGYLVLPEKPIDQIVEDFLSRKYAMVILGPWVTREAEKRYGPDWESRIGATLPPKIGAGVSTTIKGGSLFAVLDPRRGKDPAVVVRARRLVEFFGSIESQRRYTRALGALPANPQVLAESRYYHLFTTALERGKTYPEIPEWAPVVENLATRDNLYAYWKRLSAIAGTYPLAGQAEQATREKFILAALHSAQTDVNKELSPGKLSFLWPWLLALILVLSVGVIVSVWRRRVELKRIEELRQTRDMLATLQRRMSPLQESLPTGAAATSQDPPTLIIKGYPALYLHTAKRKVFLKMTSSEPLEEILHGAEYDLFRHIIECLQAGWYETHWIWSYSIWPEGHPKFPKEAFAIHCTKLRKEIESVWSLGKMLGRGSSHGGAIPIEVRDVHFYTDVQVEDGGHSIWSLFHASEQSLKAYKAEQWEAARHHVEQLLQIDAENWPGNILLCQLAIQNHAAEDDPFVRNAIAFAHKQRAPYEHAIEMVANLPEEKVSPEQTARLRSRLASLLEIIPKLPPVLSGIQPRGGETPWRTRDQLADWSTYLSGEKQTLSGEEIRVAKEVKRFVSQRLHWASPGEVNEYFREFVQDLALDESSWPDERLPSSEKAFKYRALDYVLAGIQHLSDDDESKAITKAQNLRKLWSTRAQLGKRLDRELTNDEVYQECRQRYGWSRPAFDHLLEFENFCHPQAFDESHWKTLKAEKG